MDPGAAMAEYLAPGVHVEEVERGAAPLEGVSTSTAGFLGPTERGPTDPRLITSFADFERTYGGFLDDSYLATAVDGFFANGGSRCYVGRIASEDDEIASGTIPAEPDGDGLDPLLDLDVDRLDFGAVAQSDSDTQSVTLSHAGTQDDPDVDIVLADHAVLETTMAEHGFSYGWEDTDLDGTDTVTLEPDDEELIDITFDPGDSGISDPGEVRHHWAQLTIDTGTGVAPVAMALEGVNGDAPADDLLETASALGFGTVDTHNDTRSLLVTNLSTEDLELDVEGSKIVGPDAGDFSLAADDAGGGTIGIEAGESAEINVTFNPGSVGAKKATLLLPHEGDNSPLVVSLSGATAVVIGADAVGPGSWGGHVAVTVQDSSMYEAGRNDLFKLIVRYWGDDADLADARDGDADPAAEGVPDPDVEEVFDDLSPKPTSSNYYVKQVNDASMLVDLSQEQEGRPAPGLGPSWLDGPAEDEDLDAGDYEGDSTLQPEDRTGFAGFETVDDISIVCVPDEHDHTGLTDALVDHCEAMDDRFAILQADQNPGTVGNLRPPMDTDMGAFYYPWLKVIDPDTRMTREVPPGGHVAGIYARSDANHGVHKAPANEVVRGIQGLQRTITKGEQEVLNPRGVNCIRAFRGRGVRVWGARTASSNPNWKYVNVRRLFLFLRESIEEGTQWVVFEPNDEQLWARVRQTIGNFLTDVWQDGALMGTTPEEAFFVKCDRSTMTQSDIENGRLICEIGVAPVRPAEFVVFRISQWTGSSE